jgi:hypothetical protein
MSIIINHIITLIKKYHGSVVMIYRDQAKQEDIKPSAKGSLFDVSYV